MTIRVYISLLSGNNEVKKRQHRIQMVLDSCAIPYELIDITESGKEELRTFMQDAAEAREGERTPLPPQIFNETVYCGDYDGFDQANESSQLYEFLKLSDKEITSAKDVLIAKRRSASREPTPERINGDHVDSVVEAVAEEPAAVSPEPTSESLELPVETKAESPSPEPTVEEPAPSEEEEDARLEQLQQAAEQLVGNVNEDNDNGDREVWPRGFSRRNTLVEP